MTSRRNFLNLAAGLCVLAAPVASFAQQSAKVHRIGFLGADTATAPSAVTRWEALRAGLRDLGYIEGKNIVIEKRWAGGNNARLPDLAAELVRLKVDVIVTAGTPGSRAASRATATIPIVMAAIGDPVESGLVANLARPGGNITGLSFFQYELIAKRIELLKEVDPRISQIGLVVNADNPGLDERLRAAVETPAKRLKVGIQTFKVRGPNEFESTLSAMKKDRMDAIVIPEDSMLFTNITRLAELALKQRLLSSGRKEFAEAGALIGYGTDTLPLYRRAAYFVDRILKGARAGDLPIERATKFELVINLKTARALGLTIPQSVLIRADKVIE